MSFEEQEGWTGLAYSEVMEDFHVFSGAVGLRERDVAVVVASAGDNVFNALLEEPLVVHGVDANAVQISLCRLKAAALESLEWREFAELVGSLGATPERRAKLLDRLPSGLVAAVFRDEKTRNLALREGLASCGKLSVLVAPLRDGLAELVGFDDLRDILTEPERDRRAELWSRAFAREEVQRFLATAFDGGSIADGSLAREDFEGDAEDALGVQTATASDAAGAVLSSLRHHFVEVEPADNYFQHRLWLGRYTSAEAVPPYLRSENHATLRARARDIRWHTMDLVAFLEARAPASVDVFNLSNVADWLEEGDCHALWREVDRTATPGARVFACSFSNGLQPPPDLHRSWHTDPLRNLELSRSNRVGYLTYCTLWSRAAESRAH